MTTVSVSAGELNPTHDLSISDGTTTYGLQFAQGPRILQEMPLSPPAQAFEAQQRNWLSGRGFQRLTDDRTGFFDSQNVWSTSDGKLFATPQWRFAAGLRTVDEYLPGNNESMAWWKLYGNTPGSYIARYLCILFAASATYSADKGYLWIRRRGTPGTLTFELCDNTAGNPGTVLQTVTKTTSDITDTISVYQLFDWTGTQSLTSSVGYFIKIYGASSDTVTNHWEVLCNAQTTNSKYSAAGSVWTTAIASMYYRITDADTARKWWFFILEGAMYAVDMNDSTAASVLKTNGVRGTATAGGSASLTDTNLAMTTNQFAGARLRIYDGTGDGQDKEIESNTGTVFSFATNWDVTPSTDSKYFVYSTKWFTTTTGTPGLGKVLNQPAVADKTAYFPQGAAAGNPYIRRMYVVGSSHTFAADGTSIANSLYFNTDPSAGNAIYAGFPNTASIQSAPTVAQGTNLTFANTKYIGSSNYKITNMFNYNGLLHIFKEDGPYILNGNRIERLTSGFGDVPDPSTGIAAAAQDNYMWWSWGHSVIRTLGRDSTDMLNWRQGYDGLPADRRGIICSIVSAIGWTFFAVDGGRGNYSSVLCWNGYGWHEVFRGWARGVRIRNIFWQSCVGTRGRLWVDINGELVFMDFPLFSANPLKDTELNYQHEAVLTTATIDANDALLYKIFDDLKILLEGEGTIDVDYQTNAGVGLTPWTVLDTASNDFSELTLNLGGILQIRFRLRIHLLLTQTPTILYGWMTQGRQSQPAKYQWVGTFRVSTDQDTKTSETDHNPNTLYTQLQTWSTNQTKLTLRTLSPSSDNKTVTISLPAKSVDYISETDWGGHISFAILQV